MNPLESQLQYAFGGTLPAPGNTLEIAPGLRWLRMGLPSHGKPFRRLHTRIAQLNDHHRERLAEVLAACVTPQSAADIVPVMFRRALDAHQLTFALGEALAHLHKLWFDGILLRENGADGVIRFRAR